MLVELDEIFLKTSQESHYLSILAEEIKISPNVKILDLGLLPKYKAKVNFVSPLSKRETFVNHPHPFFGVSLENSNFNRPKLLASLEWIANRFSKCTVLIGDSIHRITLGLNENLSDESALKRSLTLGKDFLIDNLHVFKRFEKRCSFNFLFCSEIQGYKDYTDYHSYLKDLFKTDKKFKASVQAFSEDYHSKRQHSVPVEQWERLISGSCNYFLEEFAIFACLQKRGFSTMIYPGSFSTLSEIAAGLHGKALKELRELVVVSLQLKKR